MDKRIVKKIARGLELSTAEVEEIFECKGIDGAIVISNNCAIPPIRIRTTNHEKSWSIEKRRGKVLVFRMKGVSLTLQKAWDREEFEKQTTYEPKHEL
jgi:hypothetical protein